jgi:hypothetical protein
MPNISPKGETETDQNIIQKCRRFTQNHEDSKRDRSKSITNELQSLSLSGNLMTLFEVIKPWP